MLGANVTNVDIVNKILVNHLSWILKYLVYERQHKIGIVDRMSKFLPIIRLSFAYSMSLPT